MNRFQNLKKNFHFCRFWLGLLALSFLVGFFEPTNSWAVLRDSEFIRQNSPPYVAQAQKALKGYEKDLRQGKGERENILLRLAQVCYNLGELAEDSQRLAYYEKGRDYAELLRKEKPGWVKGHYWLAQNLSGVAEVGGAGRALRSLPEIVEILEKVALSDPIYDQAGAHRALGSIFYEAPDWPLSVGDPEKALQHLTRAVEISPKNSTNQLFLGDLLIRLGKKQEAQAAFAKVFTSTQHSVWPQGVEHDCREARRLLAKLKD